MDSTQNREEKWCLHEFSIFPRWMFTNGDFKNARFVGSMWVGIFQSACTLHHLYVYFICLKRFSLSNFRWNCVHFYSSFVQFCMTKKIYEKMYEKVCYQLPYHQNIILFQFYDRVQWRNEDKYVKIDLQDSASLGL